MVDGAPTEGAGEVATPPALLRERPLPEETFPESLLDGRETDEGPPIESEPDSDSLRSLPDRERERDASERGGGRGRGSLLEREASERGGRRGGRVGGGDAGGCGKIGVVSPPGTLSSDHVTLRFEPREGFDPRDDLLRRLLSDFFS